MTVETLPEDIQKIINKKLGEIANGASLESKRQDLWIKAFLSGYTNRAHSCDNAIKNANEALNVFDSLFNKPTT